jgi:hypothetical protein
MFGANRIVMGMMLPTGPADPYWSSTVLLLQNFGTAGTASFTDLTGRHTVTTLAGGSGETARAGTPGNFDSTSLLLTNTHAQAGSDAGLDLGSSADWSFGTSDFTVEAMVYLTTASGQLAMIVDGRATGGSSTGFSYFYNNGPLQQYTNGFRNFGGNLTLSTWSHCAWSRNSGVTTFYQDGVAKNNFTDTINYSDGVLKVGTGFNSNDSWIGNLDMIRITTGVGRYTANFTAITADFPTH